MSVLDYEVIQAIKQAIGPGSVLVHARPRGGKGTQTVVLGKELGAPVFSSGDLSRSADLPPEVAAIRDAGGLIPSEDFFRYVLPSIGGSAQADMPIVLDAVGRMYGEEQEVMRVMAEQGHPIVAVVYINVSEDETRRRGALGRKDGEVRADDGPEEHENRLLWFRKHTLPVIDSYRELGLLVEVDGELPIDVVTFDTFVGLHDLLVCGG